MHFINDKPNIQKIIFDANKNYSLDDRTEIRLKANDGAQLELSCLKVYSVMLKS